MFNEIIDYVGIIEANTYLHQRVINQKSMKNVHSNVDNLLKTGLG